MAKIKKEFGKHYLVEFIGCNQDKCKFIKDVKPAFIKAARISQATIVEYFFHQYKPFGVTGIILISESHFSIHTWPEDNYITFDILTCGRMKPLLAIHWLKKYFQAKKVKMKVLSRGF